MSTIDDLVQLMARLRDPINGCPWDCEQDFQSIAPFTIEEAYEVADAIHHLDENQLQHELGDLLFQVVYHAQMAQEQGMFNFQDVVDSICTKIIERHPHVFSNKPQPKSAKEQSLAWEKRKLTEQKTDANASILADIGRGHPEWIRAVKLQKRAASVGFDWVDWSQVMSKIREETEELHEELVRDDQSAIEDELGDLFFSCINLSRHLDVDPSRVIAKANNKFTQRFMYIEEQLKARQLTLESSELELMEELWEESKNRATRDPLLTDESAAT